MATSGTYSFAPALGDLVLDAYGRIQIRGGALTAEHMTTARREANLLLVSWANRGPNLWAIDLQTFTTVAGTATYTLPAETVTVFELYIETSSTNARVLMPVSRTEYASFPDKVTKGVPNVYWFNRQATPTITLWQSPDAAYTIKYYRMRQVQDAALAGGAQVEIPYRWIDAFVAGMAHRLARHWKPELEQARKGDYDDAYQIAASEDTEGVPIYISPGISGYFR